MAQRQCFEQCCPHVDQGRQSLRQGRQNLGQGRQDVDHTHLLLLLRQLEPDLTLVSEDGWGVKVHHQNTTIIINL